MSKKPIEIGNFVEPTPFEVMNAQNMPLIRHQNCIINMNRVHHIIVSGDVLELDMGEEVLPLEFINEIEAQLAFDMIMGGKKATPGRSELKIAKNRNRVLEQDQAKDIESHNPNL